MNTPEEIALIIAVSKDSLSTVSPNLDLDTVIKGGKDG